MGTVIELITTLDIPQGTTAGTNVSISLSSPTLHITAAYISFMPPATVSSSSTMKENSSAILVDMDGDSATETAIFSVDNIVNKADGEFDGPNDKVQFSVIVQVVDTYGIVYGSTITASLMATYLSGYGANTTLNQLSADPLVFTIAGPNLIWNTVWDTNTSDAGDVVNCAIQISHANTSTSAAYLVDVMAALHPYMELVSGSVVSNSANTTTLSSTPVAPSVGLVGIAVIGLGDSVWINFTATLTNSVIASSYINVSVFGAYSTAPTNGSIVNVDPIPASVFVPTPHSNLSLGNSSNVETLGSILSIGEYFSHYVTINVPEGTTLHPEISVNVPANLMAMISVFVNDQGGNIVMHNFTYTLSSNQSSSNNSVTARFNSIVNSADGDTTNDYLVLGFKGVVLPSNITNGTELESVSTFVHFSSSSTLTEASQTVINTVVVPDVNMTEVCTLVSTTVQSGSVFTCTLTILPVNMLAPAYDLVIKNVASSELDITYVLSSMGAATASSGAFTVTVPILDPAVTSNIVVEYNVTLTDNTKSGASISFPVNLTYLSSPSMYGASYTILASDSAAVLESTLAIAANSSSVVSVGDTVSLIYTLDLIEGITPNTSLKAQLSVGLSAVQATVVAINAGCTILSIGSQGVISDADMDGSFDTIEFAFGDLCNPFDGARNSTDKVVIEVIARVEDVPSNTAGTELQVNGTLNYNNYTTSAFASLKIEGPLLEWTVVWDKTSGDAGDSVACSIVIQHSANSTRAAFNVDITSQLAPNLQYGSMSANYTASPATHAAVPSSWQGVAGITSIPLGTVVQLNFSATLTSSVLAGSTFSIVVAGNYSTASTLGRVTVIGTSVSNFTVLPVPASTISIDTTSNIETLGNEITVGEIVTSVVSIIIPEGTMLSPRVAFNISGPVGISILAAYIKPGQSSIVASNETFVVSGPGSTNTSALATFSSIINQPDNVASNDKFDLSFMWVVLPWANVSNNDTVQTHSQLEYSTPSGSIYEDVQVSTATILVQDLQVQQNCTSTSKVQSGAQFACVVSITPNTSAPVYNLTLGNIDSIYLSLVGGSISTSLGSFAVNNGTFTVSVPVFDPAVESSITIQYGVSIANAALLGTTVEFPVSTEYHSSPSIYGARKTVTTKSYAAMEAIAMSALHTASSLSSSPSSNVSIGEQVTILYKVSVPSGTAEKVTFIVQAPEGLSLVKVTVQSIVNVGSCASLVAGSTGALIDLNGDGWNEIADLTFNKLCNHNDGQDNDRDQITVEVLVAVVDVPSNLPGTNFTIPAIIQYNNVSSSSNVISLNLVQPELQFTITPDITTVSANGLVRFSAHVNHSSTSSASAYSLSLVSAHSSFVQFVPDCTPAQPLSARFLNDTVEVDAANLVRSNVLQFDVCARVSPTVVSSSNFNLSFTFAYLSAPSVNNPSGRQFNVTVSEAYSTVPVVQTVAVASTSNFPGVPGNHNVSENDVVILESIIMFPAGKTLISNFTLTVPVSPILTVLNSTVSSTPGVTRSVSSSVPGVTASIVDRTVSLNFQSSELDFTAPLNVTVTTAIAVGSTTVSGVAIVEQFFDGLNSDNAAVSTKSNVSIYVNPLPDAPNIVVNTPKNTPVDIEIWTESSDPQKLRPDSLYVFTQPTNGTSVRNGNETIYNATSAMSIITYTPALNTDGLDSFTYSVKNTINGVATGTIFITVDYIDYPPVITHAIYYTYENVPIEINLLSHAFDVVCLT